MAAHNLLTPSATSTRISQPECRAASPLYPTLRSLKLQTYALQYPWLGTSSKLSLNSSNFRTFVPRFSTIKATVLFSLPTSWSSKAIKSFTMSELEARKLKYPTTGTEALLMGILIEGTNFASKFLRSNGITLSKVREEAVKLLGKADMFFFSPEHPPLTEDGQKALDWAIDENLKSGDNGEITTVHFLLGIWSQEESPGHKILAAFGFNNEKAKELCSVVSEPGFSDD